MTNPPIWQSPAADALIKNGSRSFRDGDVVSIPFTFQRTVSKVRYIKGTVPYGASAASSGITGTITRKNPPADTAPRDYVLTVRAYSAATSQEIIDGVDSEFYEDRTFTIVGGLWYGPYPGNVYSDLGQALVRGDTIVRQMVFDPGRTIKRVEKIGGELPPGIAFSSTNSRLTGTIATIPKGVTSYPVVFRAVIQGQQGELIQDRSFNFLVNPIDEQHGWDTNWLTGLTNFTNSQNGDKIYNLGTVYRGGAVEIPLMTLNPDSDPLEFKATGYSYFTGTWFAGLPRGLKIDRTGRIIGAPAIAANEPGDYYFRVYAHEPSGAEGSPRTSELVFRLILSSEIRDDQQLNDNVRWVTPVGSLGSTYETYASHFYVSAVPQVSASANSLEYQTVRYQLVGIKPLPEGLFLDENTGEINGRAGYISSDQIYDFTIRARIVFVNRTTAASRLANSHSDRNFNITLKNLYLVDAVSNIYIQVPPLDRTEIAKWVFGTKPEYRDPDVRAPSLLTVLGKDILFRNNNPFWGRITDPKILLVGGLRATTPADLNKELKDYHHLTKLRINEVKTAKAYDPSGVYIYDMVYLTVTDPGEGAAGFDAFGRDIILPMPSNKAVTRMNLPSSSDRYHAMSLMNARQDLINTKQRTAWSSNSETAEARGIGLAGTEGLPLWMSCNQTPGKPQTRIGYLPAIELAYLKPGKGQQAVKSLVQAGFQDAVQGSTITVDRYLVVSDGYQILSFDLDPQTEEVTTFDGPDGDQPTAAFTSFDQILEPSSKYYKFPPGDV